MKLLEFKQVLMRHQLKPFYVFVGEEIGVMNIYLEQMSKVTSLPIIRLDTINQALLKSGSGSLFGSSGGIYVVREDNDFMKSESAFQRVENLKNSYIIMLCNKLDTRLKFAKHFKDSVVEFEKLTHDVLVSYISKSAQITAKQCDILYDYCNGYYDIAMLECDKINQYSQAEQITTEKAFSELLFNNNVTKTQEYNIFEFTHLVCSRQIRNSFKVLHELLNSGNSSVALLGTLYKSIKAILLIQVCDNKDVAGTTGLDNGQIYYNRKYVNNYDVDTLLFALNLIMETVIDIKTGNIEDYLATDFVLTQIYEEEIKND